LSYFSIAYFIIPSFSAVLKVRKRMLNDAVLSESDKIDNLTVKSTQFQITDTIDMLFDISTKIDNQLLNQ
jgi:hypothetical protein